MQIKRIILVEQYVSGSASSNRMVCYAKGYRDLGLDVVLLLQSNEVISLPRIDGIKIVHVEDGGNGPRFIRILKRIRNICNAIKGEYIQGQSVVQVYNVPPFLKFINKKHYDVFCEIGEIPYYAEIKSFSYRIKEKIRLSGTKNLRGVIVLTNALKTYYCDYGIKNIEVSNVIVDKERFEYLTVNEVPHKTIAYCGTISRHKDGVDDLIKAFKVVYERYPDYYLILMGGFSSAYQDESYLKQLTRDLGIENRVFFTGKISPDDMPQRLFDASILALARPNNIQAQYGFPTKVGEYLCTGNPVVLTRVGELDLFLKDRENCIFAKPDCYIDFAEKLIWVIEHPQEAKAIGYKGRHLINTEFSPINQCGKVLSFMERVLTN